MTTNHLIMKICFSTFLKSTSFVQCTNWVLFKILTFYIAISVFFQDAF